MPFKFFCCSCDCVAEEAQAQRSVEQYQSYTAIKEAEQAFFAFLRDESEKSLKDNNQSLCFDIDLSAKDEHPLLRQVTDLSELLARIAPDADGLTLHAKDIIYVDTFCSLIEQLQVAFNVLHDFEVTDEDVIVNIPSTLNMTLTVQSPEEAGAPVRVMLAASKIKVLNLATALEKSFGFGDFDKGLVPHHSQDIDGPTIEI